MQEQLVDRVKLSTVIWCMEHFEQFELLERVIEIVVELSVKCQGRPF